MKLFRGYCLLLLCLSISWQTLPAESPTPGQNVNMVSGTGWPGGDPFLQRQNEPSMAVSSRNSQHLLAGANDYRTVDLNIVDQLPIDQLAGDAWLGVFKSFDGGRHWASTLLPGFPQDASPFGVASPLKGFSAASDPVVRAGTNGLFYYSGIAFNRGSNVGVVFVTRFIDLNNKENGDVTALANSQLVSSGMSVSPAPTDPIRYVGTVKVDNGTSGQFIDKPWIAVDVPRANAGTCTIQTKQADGTTVTQTFPAGNVYMAFAKFVGGQINVRSKINFSRSTDCGATWSNPVLLSQTYKINQGTQVAVDPETGYVYVAWRVFNSGSDTDEIVIAKSTDGGNTFSKAVSVASLPPFNIQNPNAPAFFDQGTTGSSFRTSAVPTLAVDDSGSPFQAGRVYLAWSQRGMGTSGDARIVLTSSPDGLTGWTTPVAVDNGAILDDAGGSFARGHQIMPAMTFIQGKLELLYYDLRLDHTIGFYLPNAPLFEPDQTHNGRLYRESRHCAGELPSDCNNAGASNTVFGPFITDAGLTSRRHTMDVMLAQSSGGAAPAFSYARVSQYDFGLPSQETDELEQLQQNPPNLPMFGQGLLPFIGDYVDITGPMFVANGNGWKFNNPQFNAAPSPANAAAIPSAVFYGTWTSNQDVIPPADGNWQHYNPIPLGPTSVYNGAPIPSCQQGLEADRNQNIYESLITQGLLVSSPQNSKPLSATVQRGIVVLTQNFTGTDKSFRLTIANQPPGNFALATTPPTQGGFASFQQALPNQPALPNPLPAPVTTKDVTIPAHSGAASTVFALSSVPTASITVNVVETATLGGTPVPGGLSSFIVLNADPLNPTLLDPDGNSSNSSITNAEIYTPNITTPNITTPNITTPNITTPNITTPGQKTPNITTPNITTPNITTPNITTPTISNPNITTPNITTPNITTSTPADATYTLSNKSNTNAGYHVHVTGNSPTPLQLIVSQVYNTPTSYQCQLIAQSQNITLANVQQVQFASPGDLIDPNFTPPGVTDVVVPVAPGDSVFVTLRGVFNTTSADDAIAQMTNIVNTQVTPVITPQGVSTNSTATVPVIATPTNTPLTFLTTLLPATVVGQPSYQASIAVTGGTPPYSFAITDGSLPPGMSLNSAGVVSGTATQDGSFTAFIQATDSSSPVQTANQAVTLVVNSPQIFFSPRQPTGVVANQPFSTIVTVIDPSGAAVPGASVSLSLAAGTGVLFGGTNATTDATGHAQFTGLEVSQPGRDFVIQAVAQQNSSNPLNGFTDPFDVAAPALTLFGVNSADDGLSIIDRTTGQVTFLGSLSPAGTAQFTTPIAMSARPSDRTLFVWNNSPQAGLLTVNTCSALGSAITGANAPPQPVLGAIAFSPDGVLFGENGDLYRIDTQTGVATLVGSSNPVVNVFGMAFDPKGNLWGILASGAQLVRINTLTGAVISTVNLSQNVGTPGDLVFAPDGTLIGSAFGNAGNLLFDVDPNTGTVSNIRTVTGGFPPQGMGFTSACPQVIGGIYKLNPFDEFLHTRSGRWVAGN